MTVSSAMQLSSRIGGIKVSRSLVARERARQLRAEGRDIIDLTTALSVPLDRDLAPLLEVACAGIARAGVAWN